ncbi:MAG: hypothetical protein AAGA73_00990 [Pseudomonadota bacterium]
MSAGGLCFGDDVVKGYEDDGEMIRGGRRSNDAEAMVVREIFKDFAAGQIP